MSSRQVRLVLLLALPALACARRVETAPDLPQPGAKATTPAKAGDPALLQADRTIRFEPVEIISSPEQVAISELNDEELFAIGMAAMGGGDNAKAALHFERLADFFPESPHRAKALYNAGAMLERMKDYAGALARFTEAAQLQPNSREGAEAIFKAADAYYFLGEYEAAAGLLATLTDMSVIPTVRRVEAETKRAICLFGAQRYDDAEKVLRNVINSIKEDLRDEVRDGYLPSQAQFYLAEVYRAYFQNVVLDPTTSTQEKLLEDLEYKAKMLLSAQGHYLRCIRIGHPEWATASGFRIGELYQKLHEQMDTAKVPADLEPEQADVYRAELRLKIRVLVTKAIDAYEKTLSTAERVGATNPFVKETREQLERMKAQLLEDEATAKGQPPATTPAAEPDAS